MWSFLRMKLRKRQQVTYRHLHKYEYKHVNSMHHGMQHYTMKSGVKRFKDIGISASNTECQHLYDQMTFNPVDRTKLTNHQNKGALRALMFLK